jgi:integrase
MLPLRYLHLENDLNKKQLERFSGLIETLPDPTSDITAACVATYMASLRSSGSPRARYQRVYALYGALIAADPSGDWSFVADAYREDRREDKAMKTSKRSGGIRGKPRTKSLPIGEWPACLREAFERGKAAKRPMKGRRIRIKGREGVAKPLWRPATAAGHERALGRYAFEARKAGLAADFSEESIDAFVDNIDGTVKPISIKRYLATIRDVSIHAPGVDLEWLGEIVGPEGDELETRIAPMVHPSTFLKYALLQWRTAGDLPRGSIARVTARRNALMLAFAVLHPVRRKNIADLQIGANLIRNHAGAWRLKFSADEMKNDRPYECDVDSDLSGVIDEYIEIERSSLLRGERDLGWLWCGLGGGHVRGNVRLGAAGVYKAISAATLAACGYKLYPHVMRHVCASWLAIERPAEMWSTAKSLLGHARSATTKGYAFMGQQVISARKYREVSRVRRKAAVQRAA